MWGIRMMPAIRPVAVMLTVLIVLFTIVELKVLTRNEESYL